MLHGVNMNNGVMNIKLPDLPLIESQNFSFIPKGNTSNYITN